jgi:uncharacterized protein (TIGR02217 family)
VPLVYPTLAGLTFSITKAPRFATRVQKAISGRELRVVDQLFPIWTWTLIYSILRNELDSRAPSTQQGFFELQTLAGFFLQQQGSFGGFLFYDPTDNVTTGAFLGTGDATTTVFQLQRNFGGFFEPIIAPNVVSAIYFNGVLQSSSGYTVSSTTGLVTFTSPPPNGVTITVDFSYYFLVRFSDDTADFENFMINLWELKQIKLQSVLL